MVYLQFPSHTTEEEQTLQRKYQKLKRKKKVLQQHKSPKAPEPVTPAPLLNKAPKSKADSGGGGTDAKEVAKKLLKSGKIHAIKAPEGRRQKERQESGFKRSKAHERKRCTGTDKPGGYTPFHNQHSMEDDPLGSSFDLEDNSPGGNIDQQNKRSQNLNQAGKPVFESYHHSRDPHSVAREETYREKKRDGKANYVNRDNPLQGNTIYVRGENMSENFLRVGFSSFGTVLNIVAEPSKNCGFVTYDSIDTANMAINEMNDTALHGIRLKVSLARRQSVYNPEKSKAAELAATVLNSSSSKDGESVAPKGNSSSSSSSSISAANQCLSTPEAWSAMASSCTDGAEKPKNRTVISYDEDDIYESI